MRPRADIRDNTRDLFYNSYGRSWQQNDVPAFAADYDTKSGVVSGFADAATYRAVVIIYQDGSERRFVLPAATVGQHEWLWGVEAQRTPTPCALVGKDGRDAVRAIRRLQSLDNLGLPKALPCPV